MNIEYQKFLNESMLEFVKKVLIRIQAKQLYSDQLLYISYRTNEPLVLLPARIKERYPEEITIVVQYQFEDLLVESEGFSVTVSFDEIKETIYVPFNSLVRFIDPTNGVSLEFSKSQPNTFEKPSHKLLEEKTQQPSEQNNKQLNASNNVIFLDKFRKPNKLN